MLSTNDNNALKISWPVVVTGSIVGLILSWSILTGDIQGRVNIFYLLLVYLFIPVVSVFMSLLSLLFGKGINLARMLNALPIWSNEKKALIRKAEQVNLDSFWFLMQSQAAGIAYSTTSLLIYLLLLLSTDLNFVWRSTILQPADVLPILKLLAAPWTFWQEAQPSLELLVLTQDSRLISPEAASGNFAAWWKFIFAIQLTYSFILRLILLFISRELIRRAVNSDIEKKLQSDMERVKGINETASVTIKVTHHLPNVSAILNWDNIEEKIISQLSKYNSSAEQLNRLGRIDSVNQNFENAHENAHKNKELLILVKAWEPPLGELEDILNQSRGYVLPLDWNEKGLMKIQNHHLQEWSRLAAKFSSWQLFVPEELMPDE